MATGRALALGLLFLVGAGFWIRASEIVASVVYVTESIPAIPAVAALLILLFANYLLRRSGRRLTPGELVFAFCFVCVGAMTFGVGVVRFLLALITRPSTLPRRETASPRRRAICRSGPPCMIPRRCAPSTSRCAARRSRGTPGECPC